MVRVENECCSCAVHGYPCLGSGCPNRNVKHLYCDKCKADVEKLYKYDGEELCKGCLLKEFEVIE